MLCFWEKINGLKLVKNKTIFWIPDMKINNHKEGRKAVIIFSSMDHAGVFLPGIATYKSIYYA